MSRSRGPRERRTGKRLRVLDCTAAHEAGHAIVAIHYGLPISYVTLDLRIRDGEEEDPHTEHPSTRDTSWLLDSMDVRAKAAPPERYALLLAHLVVGWGGIAAERVLCRRAPQSFWSRRPEPGTDADQSLLIARMFGLGGRRARRFVDRFQGDARRIVVERWSQVEAVADRLLAKGTISGGELQEIVARTRARPWPTTRRAKGRR